MPGTRRIRIDTENAACLTTIDSASEVDPRVVGLSPAQVAAIWSAVVALYRTRVHPAVFFSLRYRGRIILNRAIGHAGGVAPEAPVAADARPALADTPVCLFSASKAIIAVLIHQLAETGAIALDAPVARYLPAFGCRGKQNVTIADVLTHRGGFPRLPVAEPDPTLLADWDRCIERICRAPARPGNAPAYHAMTGGFILGEIIRRVTGTSLADYLDQKLRRPLGMRYFTYGLDGRSRSRVAINHVAGMPVRWPLSARAVDVLSLSFEEAVAASNRDSFMEAVIPSGNLYATAEEVGRFYQMLLDDGRYQGRQVIAPATLARARRPVGHTRIDRMLCVPVRYSEGFMLGHAPLGLHGPFSQAAYGHPGFMNNLCWADPARDVSCALLTTGKAVLGGHLAAVARLLFSVNRHCGGLGPWR